MASAPGFIIYAVTEGAKYKTRRATYDQYLDAVETRRLPDESDKLEGWIAFTVLVFDHDFVLGGPRDAQGGYRKAVN